MEKYIIKVNTLPNNMLPQEHLAEFAKGIKPYISLAS